MIKKETVIETIKKFYVEQLDKGASSDVVDCCAELRHLINALLEDDGWIPVSERVPSDPNTSVLVQVTGRCGNVMFQDALLLAFYDSMCGWILKSYPESEDFEVFAWHELPEPYTIMGRPNYKPI